MITNITAHDLDDVLIVTDDRTPDRSYCIKAESVINKQDLINEVDKLVEKIASGAAVLAARQQKAIDLIK